MAALAYSGSWQRIRKALIASGLWIGMPCWRCGLPMLPGQKLDLGHVVDVADGGMGGPVALEHSSCNRRAGGKAGTELRAKRLEPLRSPEEKAAHNHRVAVRQRRAWKQADQELNGPGREW